MLAAVLFANSLAIIHWRPVVAKFLSIIVPVAGLLVCWCFNKFRPAFALLVLVIAEWLLQGFVRGTAAEPGLATMVRDTVAVLLPLNLAWLALGREKGLVNLSGLIKLLFIVLQPLLVFLIYLRQPELLSYSGRDWFPADYLQQITLAQPAIAAYLLSLVVLLINLHRQGGVIDRGFIWALIASYCGVAVYNGLLSTICLGLAGLILVVSVGESAYTMAFRDDLTGLPSRRALNELFLRLRGDYTVAMLDIDLFKKFNDSYGHEVGDQVLKMVAAQIGMVTGGGLPFRYGGEEFTVVFPGKKVAAATEHLEKIRSAVESSGFLLRNTGRVMRRGRRANGSGSKEQKGRKKIGVTISIGAASRNELESSPAQILKNADMALYKAKKAGRNRLVF